MHLIDTQRSGNAWKVRLLAGYLGIALERTTLSIDNGDLRNPEFMARHPLSQVPILELDDGRVIWESMAILRYLAEGSAFWPSDSYEQAQVLTWLSFEQSQHMRPIAQLRLHLALRRDKRIDDPDMAALRPEALHALQQLDARLAAQEKAGCAWVATAGPTIADVALYPYTRLAPMGQIDLTAFPAIEVWLARMEALPGYAGLFPGKPELNYAAAEHARSA
jgi:glutathione S-transferase